LVSGVFQLQPLTQLIENEDGPTKPKQLEYGYGFHEWSHFHFCGYKKKNNVSVLFG